MEIAKEVRTTETIKFNQSQLEDLVRKAVVQETGWKSHEFAVSIYERTIYAEQVMGAIDDMTEIVCTVTRVTEEK